MKRSKRLLGMNIGRVMLVSETAMQQERCQKEYII